MFTYGMWLLVAASVGYVVIETITANAWSQKVWSQFAEKHDFVAGMLNIAPFLLHLAGIALWVYVSMQAETPVPAYAQEYIVGPGSAIFLGLSVPIILGFIGDGLVVTASILSRYLETFCLTVNLKRHSMVHEREICITLRDVALGMIVTAAVVSDIIFWT